MPLPLVPLIVAGATLAGNYLNSKSQSDTNATQLAYAREMYDKQRADALADWDRQNQYNSPLQQMARFKEAGLNPNLIYGQMSNAPAVRSSSPQSYSPTAPQYGSGIAPAISQYYNTQLQTAQIDAVKTQAESSKQDVLLKSLDVLRKTEDKPYFEQLARANANKALTDAGQSLYDLTDLSPAKKELLNLQAQGQASLNRLNSEQIIKVQQEVSNLKKTGDLLEFEKKLKEFQVNNQDINNIVNLVTKVLGLVPGIGGLFK